MLEEQGVIEHKRKSHSGTYDYCLTESGQELKPIILGFGTLRHRRAKNKIAIEDIDAGFLLWDMRRRLNTEFFGGNRVEIHIEFTDQKNQIDIGG